MYTYNIRTDPITLPACCSLARAGKYEKVHKVESDYEKESSGEDEYEIWAINSSKKKKPYTVNIEVEAKSIPMELDIGASLTLVSEETYRSHWSDKLLRETKTQLYTYSGESISVY